MKLSKLYSNQDDKFEPILFNQGFNVILGDVTKPKNSDLDSHNLGKTTLARLLDFMFLVKRNKEQFLFVNPEIFQSFVFYLEVQLLDNTYLTIKRGVSNNSKISLKKHTEPNQDYRQLTEGQWDYFELVIDRAKDYLDGQFNFSAVPSWHYRKLIGYLIRIQEDFQDVFQLKKYRGSDSDWKPYMADLLGFNGELAKQNYITASQFDNLKQEVKKQDVFTEKSATEALSKIDNQLLISQKELTDIQSFVETFNFSESDQQTIESLVKDIDSEIISLNMREYTIKNSISHIEQSLVEDKIEFNPKAVKSLFEETSILFPDQITKDFEQLIAFNKAISEERNGYLNKELLELKKELITITARLETLNEQRASHLSFLQEKELISKFKEANLKIAEIQAAITYDTQKKERIQQIIDLQEQQQELKTKLDLIVSDMQKNVTSVNNSNESIFSKIRLYFNEIIQTVLSKQGIISVFLNTENNLEFTAQYQEKGKSTQESKGSSYKTFLCIAFDMAVARAYLDQRFPRFIYMDGAFDGLDDRKKGLLLQVFREYSNIGLQIIITTIKSEIQNPHTNISEEEVILKLHDDGQDGRLFKMQIW